MEYSKENISDKDIQAIEKYEKMRYNTQTWFDRGGHHIYKGVNDLVTTNPNLIKDWDWYNERYPWEYTSSSHKKVNWICHVCRNKWEATVDSRSRGNGCPKCSNKSSMPELVIEEYLKANDICYKTQVKLDNFKADFIVNNEIAIEYNGSAYHNNLIDARKLNLLWEHGCKYIVIISETIKSDAIDIDLVNHYDNGKLIIEIIYNLDSTRNSLSNFHKLLLILNRVLIRFGVQSKFIVNTDDFIQYAYNNRGIARNNILQLGDSIMSEYCYEDNPDPKTISIGANAQKLKWKCNECGFVYECTPLNKARGDMCPVCSGRRFEPGYNDLKTKFPELAKEIINKNPKTLMKYSTEEVEWKCSYCGGIWKSRVVDRTRLDISCKLCGYTYLYKDRTKEYKYNEISVKYPIEYFKYKEEIISNVNNEVDLLIYIINTLLDKNQHINMLIDNNYITYNGMYYSIDKNNISSRIKAKQRLSRLFELLGEDVNNIKIKPAEI